MAKTLFPSQTFTSVYNSAYSAYTCGVSGVTFSLEIGETYSVVWDGAQYACTAIDGSAVATGTVMIGNASPFGLNSNGEPFVIAVADGEMVIGCLTDTEATSHTAAIYKINEYLIATATLKSIANAIRTKTGGTDAILVPDMASQIEGITGGGSEDGEGASWVSASGSFKATATSHTITHNLGVKPDIMMVWAVTPVTGAYEIMASTGISSGVAEALSGSAIGKHTVFSASAGYGLTYGISAAMDSGNTTLETNGMLRDSTETTVIVGGGSPIGVLVSGNQYEWFAIGGIF